ncbi:heavy-metal-associated domain-containing protein [Paracoccus salsus]|uniref:heavy-metal-associated domain-containing protein n=1 Tax=Paracoccus salsus TaxID=2911061 RepID=UPI001F22F07A|nr:heavy metal-associated domain-containing protein [Paracoccus salsus]MCF3974036.1 heavy-metal-associated domain-containing protein [Paracoccus salsus]
MIFTVPDMSCGHCTSAIETAIRQAGGHAVVDLSARTVTVEGLDRDRAATAIRDAGFQPKAP